MTMVWFLYWQSTRMKGLARRIITLDTSAANYTVMVGRTPEHLPCNPIRPTYRPMHPACTPTPLNLHPHAPSLPLHAPSLQPHVPRRAACPRTRARVRHSLPSSASGATWSTALWSSTTASSSSPRATAPRAAKRCTTGRSSSTLHVACACACSRTLHTRCMHAACTLHARCMHAACTLHARLHIRGRCCGLTCPSNAARSA